MFNRSVPGRDFRKMQPLARDMICSKRHYFFKKRCTFKVGKIALSPVEDAKFVKPSLEYYES